MRNPGTALHGGAHSGWLGRRGKCWCGDETSGSESGQVGQVPALRSWLSHFSGLRFPGFKWEQQQPLALGSFPRIPEVVDITHPPQCPARGEHLLGGLHALHKPPRVLSPLSLQAPTRVQRTSPQIGVPALTPSSHMGSISLTTWCSGKKWGPMSSQPQLSSDSEPQARKPGFQTQDHGPQGASAGNKGVASRTRRASGTATGWAPVRGGQLFFE